MYSFVSKGDGPALTFTSETSEATKEKNTLDKVSKTEQSSPHKTNGKQKPVPMQRPSLERSARLPSSPDVETKLQGGKPPIPKEKPKAGGWMKLLRKMSTSEAPANLEEMAAELSDSSLDSDRKLSPKENPKKQKQVAAVRLPSAVSGETWMGVVAEFKGRSMDDEAQDNIESMSF